MSLIDIYLLTSWLPTVFHNAGITLSLSVIATAVFQDNCFACFRQPRGSLRLLSSCNDHLFSGCCLRRPARDYLPSPSFHHGAAHFLPARASLWATGANALAASFYPTYIRSTGVGWALGIGRIGSIVGPIFGGIMLSLHWPLTTVFLAAAIPSFIGSGAILLMGRPNSRGTENFRRRRFLNFRFAKQVKFHVSSPNRFTTTAPRDI